MKNHHRLGKAKRVISAAPVPVADLLAGHTMQPAAMSVAAIRLTYLPTKI